MTKDESSTLGATATYNAEMNGNKTMDDSGAHSNPMSLFCVLSLFSLFL
jgi:hypothetical protein